MAPLRTDGHATALLLADLLQAHTELRPGAHRMALYDPTPVAWPAGPRWFELAPAWVDIEPVGRRTRGMTVCESRVPARHGRTRAWPCGPTGQPSRTG